MFMIRQGALRVTLLAFLATLCACAPATFIKQPAGWKTLEMRQDLKYDDAWAQVVDVVSQDYDIEIMSKDSGYMRTNWKFGISGGNLQRYRGRITLKFPVDHAQCKVKTEAQWINPMNGMIVYEGYDSRMNRDVYQNLGGILGRTVPE